MAIVIENGLASTTEGADEFIINDIVATGSVQWVYSVTGNDSNPGSEAAPLATIAQAISNATANNGDIIIVKSGHVETLSSAITVNKAGIKIFGIGNGSSAPKLTANAAIDCVNITANNVELNNIYFLSGTTTGNNSRVNIDAANAKIKGCTFKCGVYDQSSITITANALYAEIESCSFTVDADGPDHAILVESASAVGLKLKDNSFDGGTYNWDFAAVYSAAAHLNFVYDSNTLTNDASITHTAAAKGHISNTIAGEGSTVSV